MKKKSYKSILLTAVSILVLGSVSLAIADPGQGPSRAPVNPGNSSQPIEYLRIGGSDIAASLDVAASNALTIFDKVNSYLTIFGSLWVGGNTWIGPTTAFVITTGGDIENPTITLPTRRLNIAGTLLSKNLSHTGSIAANRAVCVQNSKLVLCHTDGIPPTETYQWYVGPWGQCINGIETRVVECRQDSNGQVVADSFCAQPKPAETRTCAIPPTGGYCLEQVTYTKGTSTNYNQNNVLLEFLECDEPNNYMNEEIELTSGVTRNINRCIDIDSSWNPYIPPSRIISFIPNTPGENGLSWFPSDASHNQYSITSSDIQNAIQQNSTISRGMSGHPDQSDRNYGDYEFKISEGPCQNQCEGATCAGPDIGDGLGNYCNANSLSTICPSNRQCNFQPGSCPAGANGCTTVSLCDSQYTSVACYSPWGGGESNSQGQNCW